MKDAAELIKAVAALLSAIAWPIIILVLLLYFRKQLKDVLSRFALLPDRLRKIKFGSVEGELEALSEIAPPDGQITFEQVRTAAKIASEGSAEEAYSELDKLCRRFETIRRTMESGRARTQEMTKIIVQMRALGPSTSNRLYVYKGSGSEGGKLAAIAMMQMQPEIVDLDWLVKRFEEGPPFIFYHAALALSNAASSTIGKQREAVYDAAQSALNIVKSFTGGEPDRQTIDVLEELLRLRNLPA